MQTGARHDGRPIVRPLDVMRQLQLERSSCLTELIQRYKVQTQTAHTHNIHETDTMKDCYGRYKQRESAYVQCEAACVAGNRYIEATRAFAVQALITATIWILVTMFTRGTVYGREHS